MAVPRAGGDPREISPLTCRWFRSDASGEQIVAFASSLVPRPSSFARNAVVLIDPREGVARLLCAARSAEPRPGFSPDGRTVAYADRDEHGYLQLFLAHLDEANGPGALPLVDLEPGVA
jgi:hypothetical protein